MYFNRILPLIILVILSLCLTASPITTDTPTFEFNVEYSQDGQISTLEWSFPNSNMVAYYICEKSTDGVIFTDFSKIVTNDEAVLEVDDDIKSDKLYYRIKTILKSGETFTSEVKQVDIISQKLQVNATFYPNPIIETANIKISNYSDQLISITVFTDQGKEVQILERQKGADHKIDFTNLDSGTYFIKATIGDEVFIEKVDVID